MKKLGLVISVLALVLGLSQCRKPDTSSWNNGDHHAQTITFSNASNGGQKGHLHTGSAADVLVYQWVNIPDGYKDVIHVYATESAWNPVTETADFSSGTYCGVLDNIKITNTEETEATFTGKITIPSGAKALRFIHFGKSVVVAGNGSATVDFATQTGVLDDDDANDDISDKVVACCDEQYTGGNVFENCELKVQFAIAKLKFFDFGTGNITVSGMNATSMNVAATGNITYTNISNSTLTLTSPGNDDFYTVFMPKTSTDYVFSNVNARAEAKNWAFVTDGYYTKGNGSQSATGNAVVMVNQNNTVNFGLPSPYQDLWWATSNLGATCGSTDLSWYGYHFAWGETKPYNQVPSPYTDWTGTTNPTYLNLVNTKTPKTTYVWENNKWGTSQTEFFKYTSADGKTTLEPADDAAHVFLGGPWRTPTGDEWRALYDNCTFEWINKGANSTYVNTFTAPTYGYLVLKGKTRNIDVTKYMFLPAAGSCAADAYHNAEKSCYFLSCSVNTSNYSEAYFARFDDDKIPVQNWPYGYRCHGMSVRPVFIAE